MAESVPTREWLRQVRDDVAELKLLGVLICHVIAAEFLNRQLGYAWPGQERLARECGVSVAGVRKAIGRIVARGHMHVTSGGGRKVTNHYHPILKTVHRGDGFSGFSAGRNPIPGTQVSDGKHATERTETCNHGPQKPNTPVAPNDKRNVLYQSAPLTSDPDFEEFWRRFPRRQAKNSARKAWDRTIARGDAISAELIEAADRYADERSGEDPRFTKAPAKWLVDGCWKDEPTPKVGHSYTLNSARLDAEIRARRGRS